MNYDKNFTAKEALENTMQELGYTPKDILHIAATYMIQNIKRICKWNGELLDLSKYAADNFDQKKWNEHIKKMKDLYGLEKKLEFQTALFAITSEPLMRDYFYNFNNGRGETDLAVDMRDDKKLFTHSKLAVSYASDLNKFIYLPSFNGNAVTIKNLDVGDYINDLRHQAKSGANPQVIIEDLFENLSQYFFLEKEDLY